MNRLLKEGDPLPAPREVTVVPERLPPRNSFVGFIEEHSALFDQFSMLTSEREHEEAGWRNSLSFDTLVEIPMRVIVSIRTRENGRDGITSREQQRAFAGGRRAITTRIFTKRGRVTLKDYGISMSWYQKRMTPSQRKTVEEALTGLNSLSANFSEAMGVIEEPLSKTRGDLFSELGLYLESDFEHFFDFESFLFDPACEPLSNSIRPFLTAFVEDEETVKRQGREGLLDSVRKRWIERIENDPTEVVLRRFLAAETEMPNPLHQMQIEKQNDRVMVSLDSEVMALFSFALALASKISPELRDTIDIKNLDVDQILKILPGFNMWPESLKRAYRRFAIFEYTFAISNIRKALDQFRRKDVLPETGTIFERTFLMPPKRKRQEREEKEEDRPIAVEEEERPQYALGEIVTRGKTYAVRLLEEGEIDRMITKKAGKLAKGDERRLQDVKIALVDLQRDPYGYGTKVLVDRGVPIEYRVLPLRRLNPGDRPGVTLLHPESDRLRIVYAIYVTKDNKRAVALEGIYTHEEFDRKFT